MRGDMSDSESALGGQPDEGRGWFLPLAWVGLAMLLSLRGLWSLLPLALDDAQPADVVAWVRANLVAAAVILVWGCSLFVLANGRSRRLRVGFIGWQSFHLFTLAASVGWTVFVAGIAAPVPYLLLPAVEAAVGGAFLWHARRLPESIAPRPGGPTAPPLSAGLRILYALAGAVVGAVLGAVAGFPFGVLLAELLDVSCFEGACGYFAGAIGLLGILLGLVCGIAVALWRTRARSRVPVG
jgi:hypothetical protein